MGRNWLRIRITAGACCFYQRHHREKLPACIFFRMKSLRNEMIYGPYWRSFGVLYRSGLHPVSPSALTPWIYFSLYCEWFWFWITKEDICFRLKNESRLFLSQLNISHTYVKPKAIVSRWTKTHALTIYIIWIS